jgi:Arc/MetJ-type ribon-helix-helix transcriptional regulator
MERAPNRKQEQRGLIVVSKEKEKEESSLSLRDEMRKRLTAGVERVGTRNVSVMTRISQELVDILDNLVKLGIFKSRSDAVAAIIERTLLTQRKEFEKLNEQLEKLDKIQGDAMDIALKALDGEN